MTRASTIFTADRRRQVADAVARAEAATSAEIVPVVATASGRYDRAEDVVGLWLGLALLAATWSLWPPASAESGSWDAWPHWIELLALIAVVVVGFVGGVALASRVGWLRHWFTPRREMRREVEERARAVFFDRRVGHTARHTGLLVYVSMFERIAVVLADSTVQETLGAKAIDGLCSTLIAELRTTDPASALCRVVESAGTRLAAVLPRDGDDVDEIPDALVVLD